MPVKAMKRGENMRENQRNDKRGGKRCVIDDVNEL